MQGFRENIIKFLNIIFRKNITPMIANITKQNYDEYSKTYNTLFRIFSKLDGANAYLIGGISAAIQTNQDLYRQNSDIDIMCNEEELSKFIQILQKVGYSVEDRRGIKTRNIIDAHGDFKAMDHELNAYTRNKNTLGVGIFTYKVKNDEVITHSYAFKEKEERFVETEKVMPKELFDLMYDDRSVDYKGINLKTQSKEYIYMTKIKGSREKDKIDASIIEPTLNDKSKAKIARIRELEAKTRPYILLYSKDGKVESKTKLPTLKEKTDTYLNNLLMKDTTKTPEQIVSDVFQSDGYHRIVDSHPEIESLIESWKEEALQDVAKKSKDESTRNINKETGKNDRDISGLDR